MSEPNYGSKYYEFIVDENVPVNERIMIKNVLDYIKLITNNAIQYNLELGKFTDKNKFDAKEYQIFIMYGESQKSGIIGEYYSDNNIIYIYKHHMDKYYPPNYFFNIMAHEIGHALRAEHSSSTKSLMFPMIFYRYGSFDKNDIENMCKYLCCRNNLALYSNIIRPSYN